MSFFSPRVTAAVIASVAPLMMPVDSSAQMPADGVIYACVTPDKADGKLRLASSAEPCKKNELRIQWNIVGPVGPQGPQGATGPQGPQGPQGLQGATGPQGPQGATGPQGASGPAGPAGPEGATGPAGAAGAKGDTGLQGLRGLEGIQGEPGPQGVQGIQGVQGEQGPPFHIVLATAERTVRAGYAAVVEQPFLFDCPSELAGFQGGEGNVDDAYETNMRNFLAVGPICGGGLVPSLGAAGFRKKEPTGHWLTAAADDGGEARSCPAGYVAVGVSGKFNQLIASRTELSEISTTCRSVATPGDVVQTAPLTQAGIPGTATPFSVQCSGELVATGIYGTFTHGRAISSIGLVCQ